MRKDYSIIIGSLNGRMVKIFFGLPDSDPAMWTGTPNSCSRSAFTDPKIFLVYRVANLRVDWVREQAVDDGIPPCNRAIKEEKMGFFPDGEQPAFRTGSPVMSGHIHHPGTVEATGRGRGHAGTCSTSHSETVPGRYVSARPGNSCGSDHERDAV